MEGYGVACPDFALTFAVASVLATVGAMTVNVGPVWSREITLAPEAQSVATARRFVREQLNVHDLPSLVDDVTLVASELATNALSHAGTPFTVTITASGDDVVLEVRDGAPSTPVPASPSGRRSTSASRRPVGQYQCGERARNRSYALHGDPYVERM